MNLDLTEVVKYYSTKTHNELNNLLLNKSKDNLISILTDLITIYINDKNSSTIREFITVSISGYKHSEQKIGYNGYKHSSTLIGKKVQCEAKPKNFDTRELIKYEKNERKTNPSKLNGSGNFTDYTFERLNRDKKENPNMLISGFVDGKLLYILEFPFNTNSFASNLEKQLKIRFPKGDIKGQYLRSANFTYLNFIDCNSIKKVFLLNKESLNNYTNCINKKFLEFLIKL